jgi:hypothetical protein
MDKVELVDDITNEIMDYLRDRFEMNADSDQDDEIYTIVHGIVKEKLK